ncbi:MAG: TolC family protein [Pseudomonadota bacterium]
MGAQNPLIGILARVGRHLARSAGRLALLFCANQAFAQSPVLTLDEALGIALADNTHVVNAQLQVEAASDEIQALKAQRFPQVDVEGAYSEHWEEEDYTFDQGIWGNNIPDRDVKIRDVEDNTGRVSAGVVQPLSQLYELSLGIEQGEVEQSVAEQGVKLVQTDLAALVKRQYFELLQAESNLKVTDESLLFYGSLTDLVGQYVEQKIALRYELLDVEARQARREQERKVQENIIATGKQRMNQLLGRDVNTPFEVTQLAAPTLYTGSLENAIDSAMSQRPDLLGSRMKIKSAELSYDLKKAEYIPEVDLLVSYTRLFNHDFIPEEEAFFGVKASWEIVDWGRRRNELASQRTQVSIARNQTSSLEEKIHIDVSRAFNATSDAAGFVEVAKLSQAAAQEKLRVLVNEYRQQSALLKDVLDAQTDLERADSEMIHAQLGVWKAQAELQRSMGEY